MERSFPALLSALSLAVLRWWFARMRARRERTRQRLSLRQMSDQELNDLGIGRSEIEAWVR
ncbi:DUF1127 domain-containing protein [Variovorax sp. E3]|jgi:uncharacterized protein YjiS (DUF1127 family)|uniref:DUF1127 domain-containing protein n=1 Tax=Variovorax sp. E3 TaxID=1914993 RepID=UPI0018DEBDA5|nr:DUF1127 domain-containing protein [Variovorax sp. E3]